ncbi:PREDICTED: uncharacterized protein LOC105116470 [Populus euphratica]|uniref:Uncharacterized protein LOC105116470 n=1 Tax=Populus euphratica TaxID=75702 RepID=A0AAJ6TJ54_POPEU|nr:PREDICTED: uncharacterized protein LOC105116470 [Populus euphratica]
MAEEDIITERNPSEEAAVDTEVMDEAVSNEKEAREDSMLCFQESPSFRVYCAHNVSVDGDGNEENGDKDENKSLKETTQKGSENQAVKRRQTRFRTPLRNGGAARMKNFKFASCSCSNPSTTQESARRSVGKVVR